MARFMFIRLERATACMYLLSTRASEVSPAMATPMWSSMVNSFFWYDASSPPDLYAPPR
jgi:hypothetical protein